MSSVTRFLRSKSQFSCILRYSSLSPNKENAKSLVREKSWLTKTIVRIFVDFTKGYERILEKRFPRFFKVYRIFMIGSQTFYDDAKDYVRIARQLRRGRKMKDLTRKELEIYYQAPRDIMRVTPVLCIAALPVAGYVMFPLAYFFPKQLMSSHFWNLQQKADFALIDHKSKIQSYKSVFQNLQEKAETITNPKLKEKCINIVHAIGSGSHPTAKDIIAANDAFENKPYNLNYLSPPETVALCRIHGLQIWWFRVNSLTSHALMITRLDVAMRREEIGSLNADDMRKACFLRGVNPINMSRDSMVQYLEQWIMISSCVTQKNVSLLLHCPILLAYNQPTNWSLIH